MYKLQMTETAANRITDARRPTEDYILEQLHNSNLTSGVQCAALPFNLLLQEVWVNIDCSKSLPYIFFICESALIHDDKPPMKLEQAEAECAGRWTSLHNSTTCIRMIEEQFILIPIMHRILPKSCLKYYNMLISILISSLISTPTPNI